MCKSVKNNFWINFNFFYSSVFLPHEDIQKIFKKYYRQVSEPSWKNQKISADFNALPQNLDMLKVTAFYPPPPPFLRGHGVKRTHCME